MKKCYFAIIVAILLAGNPVAQPGLDSIQIYPGWNLIGSTVTGSVDSIMYTMPPNAINSPIYKFNSGNSNQLAGYVPTDLLEKMLGYWVKADFPAWMYLFKEPIYLWETCGTVMYAGKTYNTIVIGDQCWLRQNLDVGTMINGSISQTNNGVIEKYCYDNIPSNCADYGGLYQWDEAMQYTTTPGATGICPNGWHIPTLLEFQILEFTVGSDGNSLKEVGQGFGSGEGTNTSGFSALLAGYLDLDETFNSLGTETYFWSSTIEPPTFLRYYLHLGGGYSNIGLDYAADQMGFSIRCIKNN